MTQITVCGKACRAWGPPPVPCGRMPGPGAAPRPQAAKPLWGTPPGHWSGAAPRGPRRATGPARLEGRPAPPRRCRTSVPVTAPRRRLPHLGIGCRTSGSGGAGHRTRHRPSSRYGVPHRATGLAPRHGAHAPRGQARAAPAVPHLGAGYRATASVTAPRDRAGPGAAPRHRSSRRCGVPHSATGPAPRHRSGASRAGPRRPGGTAPRDRAPRPGPGPPRRRAPGSPGAYRTGTVRRLRGHRSAGTA